MLLTRREALPALLATTVPALRAQTATNYPSRPIKLVVPFAPGGGPDVLTRQFLPRLGAVLGQTVFVENKVGAGGIIAAEYAAQQPPDGHTLLLGASTHVTQKLLQPKAGFDPVKGFSHVTRLSYAPSLLVVATDAPYKSLDDLLKAARATPGKLNYGSGGIGSAAHLAGAALAQQAGVEVAHIPYRGSVDLAGALIAGDVQFAIPTASTVVPQLQSGKLRALAITSAQRDALLPQLPTLKELTGSDDLVLVAWSGLWLPAGTPAPVLRTLFEAHQKVYGDPEIVKAHAALGVTVALSASEAEFSSFVAAESAKYARLVKAARIEVS
ncbi:MAG: tripartite tricarboxylate transporter substrate-binding protein [Rubrivivax sp.]